MLFIDTREHGKLVDSLSESVPVKRIVLDAGDFLIPKPQGFVLIERSTFNDFVGKIKSQRLWEQVSKCTEITDDCYLLLENPFALKYSQFNRKAVWAMITEVSRKMKIMMAMNTNDSYVFIKKLYDDYNTERKLERHETRVKSRHMTDEQQALYCLMGIEDVGEVTAKKLLTGASIQELSKMSVEQLGVFVDLKLAEKIFSVLHTTVK